MIKAMAARLQRDKIIKSSYSHWNVMDGDTAKRVALKTDKRVSDKAYIDFKNKKRNEIIL